MRATLFRHSESTANAGLPALPGEPKTTPITSRGQQQAEAIAPTFQRRPCLFVVSPYDRTGQTAQPSRERFPETPVETWPIQEFTYLDPNSAIGSTKADRSHRVAAYWTKADPNAREDGAESFVDFMDRIEFMKKTLLSRADCSDESPEEEPPALFTHGHFMRGVLWSILQPHLSYRTPEAMKSFHRFSQAIQIPNAARVLLRTTHLDYWAVGGISLDHLPSDLRTV